jgi:tetratricopeptide (TPR) repeat protein
MFKKYTITLIFLSCSLSIQANDCSITKFISDYLTRINTYILDDDYVNAKKELDTLSFRYFKNEQSYERMLINQLLGNFYGTQELYEQAIESYEAALRYRKLCLISNLQVRGNLAQAYFITKQYDQVIKVLLKYEEIATQRGQEFSPLQKVILGLSFNYKEEYQEAYKYIKSANDSSLSYNEDWLRYELSLAYKLEKFEEATDLAQLLIYLNPEKKDYWKQLSGLYFTQEDDDKSLAGLELAYNNNLLVKNNEYRDLARYFLYKNLPQKAVKALLDGLNNNYLEKTKENYELLADSYFLSRDRAQGIKYLQKSLEIDQDPKIAFKIARFAFEDENWSLSLKFLNFSKQYGWNETEGRLELLSGISLYELGRLDESIAAFKEAYKSDETKVAAEGWISFVEEIITNS